MPLMDMTRRNFLGVLLGAPAAITLIAKAATAEFTPTTTKDKRTIYRGYDLHWTGWKYSQSNLILAGQWIGWPITSKHALDETRPCLVACVPGEDTTFRRGAEFSIHPREGQRFITGLDSVTVKEVARRSNLKRLLRMVDCVADEARQSLTPEEWKVLLQEKGAIRCL